MEDIINIGTFIQHLTDYIKIGIYINKGTTMEDTLEKCIHLYNKFKTIESGANAESASDDEIFVRKCLKRLNLLLKVDDAGKPVDIRKKENQVKMVFFSEHLSLCDNDMDKMIDHASKYNINILSEIPLMFFLRNSKYQNLLWQYTRSLFYISQMLNCKVDPEIVTTDPKLLLKKKIYTNSFDTLVKILETIDKIEEENELSKFMTLDKFLNMKLIKTGINEKNVNEARQEVKDMFKKKGLGGGNTMTKIIDSISDQLTNVDFSEGKILNNMLGIAQTVAQEVRGDLENNPEMLQSTLSGIMDIFQETINNTETDNEEIPEELSSLKDMFNNIAESTKNGEELTQEQMSKNLESIINMKGINKEEIFGIDSNESGSYDLDKLTNSFNLDRLSGLVDKK